MEALGLRDPLGQHLQLQAQRVQRVSKAVLAQPDQLGVLQQYQDQLVRLALKVIRLPLQAQRDRRVQLDQLDLQARQVRLRAQQVLKVMQDQLDLQVLLQPLPAQQDRRGRKEMLE